MEQMKFNCGVDIQLMNIEVFLDEMFDKIIFI